MGLARNLDSPTAAAIFKWLLNKLHILMQTVFKRTSFFKAYKVKPEEIKLAQHRFVALHFCGFHTDTMGIGT